MSHLKLTLNAINRLHKCGYDNLCQYFRRSSTSLKGISKKRPHCWLDVCWCKKVSVLKLFGIVAFLLTNLRVDKNEKLVVWGGSKLVWCSSIQWVGFSARTPNRKGHLKKCPHYWLLCSTCWLPVLSNGHLCLWMGNNAGKHFTSGQFKQRI